MMEKVLVFTTILLLAGCGSFGDYQPEEDAWSDYQPDGPPDSLYQSDLGPREQTVVFTAIHLVGTPYLYGGIDPGKGVDCSGLVYYAYRNAGVQVPRTSREQYRRAAQRSLTELRPGDLLFFRLNSSFVSHVGIYLGDNRFVHAPSTGKFVSYASLQNRFWQARLVGGGRLLSN